MFVPKDIRTINKILTRAGYRCYIVGGAVRNYVAGLPPTDYDLASNAHPHEIMRLFRRTVPTGLDHGTITILLKDGQYEITTFRTEDGYSDARHPDRVEFSETIEADLSRRDFTMNALAWDITKERMIDLYDGSRAVKQGRIEAIGNPVDRFREDPLRILRACRFAAQLCFNIEENTLHAATQEVRGILGISTERIRDELIKLICGRDSSRGLFLLRDIGLLELILPELQVCIGVDQKGIHQFDVFEHCVYSCEGAPAEDPGLRLAALLHDIGKPGSLHSDATDEISFHRHEKIGADISRELLMRLKFPKQMVRRISHLIEQHMFNYTDEWTDAAVRRFIARTGRENIADLFRLRRADAYGMRREKSENVSLNALSRRIEKLLNSESVLSLKDLAVNGNDLQQAGIPRGRLLGVILGQLLETVLDDPEMNRRERLLPVALNLWGQLKSRE